MTIDLNANHKDPHTSPRLKHAAMRQTIHQLPQAVGLQVFQLPWGSAVFCRSAWPFSTLCQDRWQRYSSCTSLKCRPSKCDLSFPHEESLAPVHARQCTFAVISSPLRNIWYSAFLVTISPSTNHFISGSEAHTVKTIVFNSWLPPTLSAHPATI